MMLLVIGAVVFLLGTITASVFYPGGTQVDASTLGYSWLNNFLSDLGCTVSWSGEQNIIACGIFNASVFCFGFCLRKWSRQHKASMPSAYFFYALYVQGLAFIGIALSPFNILPLVHHIFVGIWVFTSIVSITLAVFYFNDKILKLFVTVLIIIGCISVFVLIKEQSKHAMTLQQKLFTLLNCLWLIYIGQLFRLKQKLSAYAEEPTETDT